MTRCLVLLLLLLNAAIAASLRARNVLRDMDLDGVQYQVDDVRDLLPLRSIVRQRTPLGDEDEQLGWIKRDVPSASEDQYNLGLLMSALRQRDVSGYKRNPKTKSKPCYWSLVACF